MHLIFKQMESGILKPRIQLTGFKNQEKKFVVGLLHKLDCIYVESKVNDSRIKGTEDV